MISDLPLPDASKDTCIDEILKKWTLDVMDCFREDIPE